MRRVLYQPYMLKSACGLIDQGFINGYRAVADDVVVWDSQRNPEGLRQLLIDFRPTHFVGYFQMSDRSNSVWINPEQLSLLLEYKRDHGLQVVVDSFPSNLRDLFGDWLDTTETHVDAGVRSFYLQGNRPNAAEEAVLESGLIDLLTSRFCVENIPTLYRNYLEYGIPVLDEPPAADIGRYAGADGSAGEKDIDLLYIGGCWSFKWDNMQTYVEPLKAHFGHRFKVYGAGWPEGISEGVLGDGSSDCDVFATYSKRAKINLCFHEPSQVLPFATAGNERIYKQLALGCFVISDPCATFPHYFEEDTHFSIARSGEEIVRKVEYYLEREQEREQIAHAGLQHVLNRHTYEFRARRVLEVLRNDIKGVISYG